MFESFFEPASVAVIGASRTPGKVGHDVVRNLLDGGFQGGIYPVNPKADEVLGLKCYPSVTEIEGEVELAVIVIPAKFVLEAVEECGRKGIRAVIVITAGFKESGKDGAALEKQLLEKCRQAGIRCIGPNCLGIMSPSVEHERLLRRHHAAHGQHRLLQPVRRARHGYPGRGRRGGHRPVPLHQLRQQGGRGRDGPDRGARRGRAHGRDPGLRGEHQRRAEVHAGGPPRGAAQARRHLQERPHQRRRPRRQQPHRQPGRRRQRLRRRLPPVRRHPGGERGRVLQLCPRLRRPPPARRPCHRRGHQRRRTGHHRHGRRRGQSPGDGGAGRVHPEDAGREPAAAGEHAQSGRRARGRQGRPLQAGHRGGQQG